MNPVLKKQIPYGQTYGSGTVFHNPPFSGWRISTKLFYHYSENFFYRSFQFNTTCMLSHFHFFLMNCLIFSRNTEVIGSTGNPLGNLVTISFDLQHT